MLSNIKDSIGSKISQIFANIANYAKHHTVGFVVGVFLVFLLLTPVAAYGYLQIQTKMVQEKNAAIESAVLNNDYKSWSSLVTDEKLKSVVDEKNFSQFAYAYDLLQQGNVKDANQIKESLGLKPTFTQTSEQSQAIKTAIESNDYNAWRSLVGSNTMTSINSDNFGSYVNAYEAASSGNISKANGYLRALDLKTDKFSSGRSISQPKTKEAPKKADPTKEEVK